MFSFNGQAVLGVTRIPVQVRVLRSCCGLCFGVVLWRCALFELFAPSPEESWIGFSGGMHVQGIGQAWNSPSKMRA